MEFERRYLVKKCVETRGQAGKWCRTYNMEEGQTQLSSIKKLLSQLPNMEHLMLLVEKKIIKIKKYCRLNPFN
jgi:hypothetical protein